MRDGPVAWTNHSYLEAPRRSPSGSDASAPGAAAIRPCLATTNGRLIVLSSPYAQTGTLYDLHRKYHGRDEALVLVWQATAPQMNPTLSTDYLQRMADEDPEAYRSEVLGEFRAGVSTFLESDAIQSCVRSGIREVPYEPGMCCIGHVDSASGSGTDRFAVSIAVRTETGRARLLVVRAWAPPFNPSGVIAEAALLLRKYRVQRVSGDRYAPGFVSEHFRSHNIGYDPCPQDRSALYLELLSLVNAQQVELLDDPELLRELRGLERRRGNAGRDHVDHRPGGHDDRAISTAGALVRASGGRRMTRDQIRLCLAAGRGKRAITFRRTGASRLVEGD